MVRDSGIENHTFHFFDLIPSCASHILFTDLAFVVVVVVAEGSGDFDIFFSSFLTFMRSAPFCAVAEEWKKKMGKTNLEQYKNKSTQRVQCII